MTWARLDDNFAEHPKITSLSHGAFRLHVAGICYCARHLTDGVIAREDTPRLIRGYRPRLTVELVDHLLWVPFDDGRYFEIHDYLQYNPSRRDVERREERNRSNARKRWTLLKGGGNDDSQ